MGLCRVVEGGEPEDRREGRSVGRSGVNAGRETNRYRLVRGGGLGRTHSRAGRKTELGFEKVKEKDQGEPEAGL